VCGGDRNPLTTGKRFDPGGLVPRSAATCASEAGAGDRRRRSCSRPALSRQARRGAGCSSTRTRGRGRRSRARARARRTGAAKRRVLRPPSRARCPRSTTSPASSSTGASRGASTTAARVFRRAVWSGERPRPGDRRQPGGRAGTSRAEASIGPRSREAPSQQETEPLPRRRPPRPCLRPRHAHLRGGVDTEARAGDGIWVAGRRRPRRRERRLRERARAALVLDLVAAESVKASLQVGAAPAVAGQRGVETFETQ